MANNIKCKYIFDKKYNPVYVNGAQGGVNVHKEIIVNFYLERGPLPNSETFEVNEQGLITNLVENDPQDLSSSVVRFVDSGVILNLESAINIYEWLGRHIETLKLIK
jgi:hypothetical protein